MDLELIEAYLQEQGVSDPIYLFAMPDGIQQGVLLKLPLNGVPVDHELPGYYRGDLQIICRATNHAAGSALAAQVMAAATIRQTLDLVGDDQTLRINFCRPHSLPIRYPRSDDAVIIEWSINFDCCFVVVT